MTVGDSDILGAKQQAMCCHGCVRGFTPGCSSSCDLSKVQNYRHMTLEKKKIKDSEKFDSHSQYSISVHKALACQLVMLIDRLF